MISQMKNLVYERATPPNKINILSFAEDSWEEIENLIFAGMKCIPRPKSRMLYVDLLLI